MPYKHILNSFLCEHNAWDIAINIFSLLVLEPKKFRYFQSERVNNREQWRTEESYEVLVLFQHWWEIPLPGYPHQTGN